MKNHGKQIFRRVFAKGFLMAPLACLTLAGCQDTEFDEYYERPSWLDAPAWNILERRGDCSNYLQLVEKTLYSKQLEGSGSYTFFVPTDAAFQAFFAENPYGYSSVADIPAKAFGIPASIPFAIPEAANCFANASGASPSALIAISKSAARLCATVFKYISL